MSWKGRKNNEASVVTYCDFGEIGRRSELSRHRSWETALRQLKRIKRQYSHGCKVWQEDYNGLGLVMDVCACGGAYLLLSSTPLYHRLKCEKCGVMRLDRKKDGMKGVGE